MPSLTIDGARVERAELVRCAQRAADWLVADGVGEGDALILALSSGLEHLAYLIAAWHLRAQVVEVAPSSSASVLTAALQRTGAKVIVADADQADRLLVEERAHHPGVERGEAPALATGAPGTITRVAGAATSRAGVRVADVELEGLLADQPPAIFFTSGSTATAKGVLLRWPSLLDKGRSILGFYGEAARSLFPLLPMSHAYGLYLTLAGLASGGDLLLTRESLAVSAVLELAAAAGVRALVCPPLFARALLLGRGGADPRLRGQLELLSMGGAATSSELVASVRSALPETRLLLSYGLVETYSTICCLDASAEPERIASVGPPRWGARVELRDPDGGGPVPPGRPGELCVAQPITDGYVGLGRPEAYFTGDGLLRTGDLAELDSAGYVFIRGRIKDIFKAGSLTIDPSEIEQALAAHPAVEDCGAYVASVRGADVIYAAVVVRGEPRAELFDELREHCRARLGAQLVPRQIVPVPLIPRGSLGKVQRAGLKDLVAQLVGERR